MSIVQRCSKAVVMSWAGHGPAMVPNYWFTSTIIMRNGAPLAKSVRTANSGHRLLSTEASGKWLRSDDAVLHTSTAMWILEEKRPTWADDKREEHQPSSSHANGQHLRRHWEFHEGEKRTQWTYDFTRHPKNDVAMHFPAEMTSHRCWRPGILGVCLV